MGGRPPRLTSDLVLVTLAFRQPLAEFRRVVPADVSRWKVVPLFHVSLIMPRRHQSLRHFKLAQPEPLRPRYMYLVFRS